MAFKVKEGVMSSLPKAVEFSYEAFYLASHGGLRNSLNIENLLMLVYWSAEFYLTVFKTDHQKYIHSSKYP